MGYALRNDRYRYVAWYKNRYSINEQDIIIKELYDYKSYGKFDKLDAAVTIAGGGFAPTRKNSLGFINIKNTFYNLLK